MAKRRSRRKSKQPSIIRSHGRRKSTIRSRGRRKSTTRSHGRRKSTIRSRGRRKSTTRSRGGRKTNRSTESRINKNRRYSRAGDRRRSSRVQKTIGKKTPSGRARNPKRGRKPKKSPPGLEQLREAVLQEENRVKGPVVPYLQLGGGEKLKYKIYEAVATLVLKEMLRNEFLTNVPNLYKIFDGVRHPYPKLTIENKPYSVQVLPPLNTTVYNQDKDNDYLTISSDGRVDKRILTLKGVSLLSSITQPGHAAAAWPVIPYTVYAEHEEFSTQEILGMFLYGPAARFGHIYWDRSVPFDDVKDNKYMSFNPDAYLKQCPLAPIKCSDLREYIEGDRSQLNNPYGTINAESRVERPGIRTVVMSMMELQRLTGIKYRSRLDEKAVVQHKEPFYVLDIPSNWNKKGDEYMVQCRIAWSAQAAEDFFANALCTDSQDGAYVSSNNYDILTPAVVALTSGNGACAHWAGMRYPLSTEQARGLTMRQGYSCSYKGIPGLSCQKNLGHGLCMFNALIYALGFEVIFMSACDAIASAKESNDQLNTLTLGFHYNVLVALQFLLWVIKQNSMRFDVLGNYGIEDIIQIMPVELQGNIVKIKKIMSENQEYSIPLQSGGSDVTTFKLLEDDTIKLANMFGYLLSDQNIQERNYWSAHFCRHCDIVLPRMYELDSPPDSPNPRSVGRLAEI